MPPSAIALAVSPINAKFDNIFMPIIPATRASHTCPLKYWFYRHQRRCNRQLISVILGARRCGHTIVAEHAVTIFHYGFHLLFIRHSHASPGLSDGHAMPSMPLISCRIPTPIYDRRRRRVYTFTLPFQAPVTEHGHTPKSHYTYGLLSICRRMPPIGDKRRMPAQAATSLIMHCRCYAFEGRWPSMAQLLICRSHGVTP